jgi:hypothetical protein
MRTPKAPGEMTKQKKRSETAPPIGLGKGPKGPIPAQSKLRPCSKGRVHKGRTRS